MDYRALGELIWFSFLGLSVFTLVTGLSVRVFLAPVIREALGKLRSDADRERQALALRMDRIEERVSDVETQAHRVAAAEEFHRRLREGDDAGSGAKL